MFSSSIKQALRTPVIRSSLVSTVRPTTTKLATFNRISSIRNYSAHEEETFEEFTARFEKEFEEAYDLFEVQRVLNNAFSYDLVPSPAVIEKALRAARRVNDYATAVRVFEGLKYKVENAEQYNAYLEELKSTREELGITLKEDLFPESVGEKPVN
ncbi:Cytochrome c oxidase subunit 5A, mitochondrial [Wickerhamomyces ciferrii]|uniref:Cytochrome c oxidase subunit 6, mitochondrial n=1 Tax=Wickerhamomyces ciferrii (strain ATCC 14091 / BCRC 22168 / CBS 111 / JCM 3599 / NBRC 0793 / NRRL Y-1031 F-60-10) TaxID=1206466 RepID=K0KQG2_WICCF|nr:Cytochrome c oxidase subunit 5A, mitochondrial [Wickerhamomyces ciferrii]CCH45266.1 Cytochrome c oxidase subunit 5A, mitochondrial [Wickerhamomyces ciferrii]